MLAFPAPRDQTGKRRGPGSGRGCWSVRRCVTFLCPAPGRKGELSGKSRARPLHFPGWLTPVPPRGLDPATRY